MQILWKHIREALNCRSHQFLKQPRYIPSKNAVQKRGILSRFFVVAIVAGENITEIILIIFILEKEKDLSVHSLQRFLSHFPLVHGLKQQKFYSITNFLLSSMTNAAVRQVWSLQKRLTWTIYSGSKKKGIEFLFSFSIGTYWANTRSHIFQESLEGRRRF